MRLAKGYVQIYTGDGKGKTTAAVGLAARAAGAGLSVAVLHFLKPALSAEDLVLKKIKNVSVRHFGARGWVRGSARPADRAEAQRGLQTLRRVLSAGRSDCVIADEACTAVSLGVLPETDLLAVLDLRPAHVELVLTGRGATPALKRRADLVTHLKAEKHYFQRGVGARRGIEF
jgi:cob(I)alamin adenosyltransferase